MDTLEKKKEELVNINFQIKEVQDKMTSIPVTAFVLNKEIADLMAQFQKLNQEKATLEKEIKDMEEQD
jgi:cell division protein FtsB